ncbi:MAG: hypothetical protein QG614_171 [Patescibacteria group bacterium]|nr:hypothetical protein [Patescibacteria group bacterium]
MAREKGKILYIITKSNWGGAQKYVFDLANSNINQDYDIKVLLGGDGELAHRLLSNNVEVIKSKTLQNTLNPIRTLKIFKELYKIIKNENPNIVHVNSSVAGLIVTLICRIQNKYCVFTAHGWPHNENRNTILKYLFKFLMIITVRLSDATIAVSNNIKHSLSNSKSILNKITVIYPGIKIIDPIDMNKLHQEDNLLHIVSVGEMNKNKNHISFIRIMNSLDNVHYHIIGQDSGEKENIEKEIEAQNIKNKVTLHGHIQNIDRMLSRYDVFLLPSHTEALGYVVLEALQNNIPVIARNVGGVPEIIENINGSTLYNDPEELIQIITKLKNEISTERNENKLKENTYQKYLADKFSYDKMITETLKIYQRSK